MVLPLLEKRMGWEERHLLYSASVTTITESFSYLKSARRKKKKKKNMSSSSDSEESMVLFCHDEKRRRKWSTHGRCRRLWTGYWRPTCCTWAHRPLMMGEPSLCHRRPGTRRRRQWRNGGRWSRGVWGEKLWRRRPCGGELCLLGVQLSRKRWYGSVITKKRRREWVRGNGGVCWG